MEQQEIEDIVLAKLANQKLSRYETKLFDKWYAHEHNRCEFNALLKIRSGVIASAAEKIDSDAAFGKMLVKPRRSLFKVAMRYAAILVIPLAMALGYWLMNDSGHIDQEVAKPANGRVILTLEDGRQVVVDGGLQVLDEEGVPQALNVLENKLSYTEIDDGTTENSYTHTIEIPRGGYWELVLSDGTHVWLNSQSKLKYPVKFGKGERVVELEGEAYFQVATDSQKPFTVKTSDCDVRVTGTEFNVMSYVAARTVTTLIEGGVEVAMEGEVCRLSPNEQAVVSDGKIVVARVDVNRYVAWKSGEFSYSQTEFGEIMDELARWYDFDVVWETQKLKTYHFTAWFSRQSELEDILNVLEKTNIVEFEQHGKSLIIKEK